ncbi:hypothetical protein D1007_22467 [Hordeum vulgare]|nr:hypothetical protein D1007_22467 [Hordeum vulgare]
MAWREGDLDLVLIPLGLFALIAYHMWLWHATRRCPLGSTIGVNAAARRIWVFCMMTDNDKKAVLVVQSIRNVLMGSTLVATTSVLFSTGVAAVLSSTYAIKQPINDATFGAHGEYVTALKFVALLTAFLLSFLCHTLAICSLNQATFLVNALSQLFVLPSDGSAFDSQHPPVTKDYIVKVLDRGFMLNFMGNRFFYGGIPLVLWIFGPVLACLSSMLIIPILYNMDMVYIEKPKGSKVNGNVEMLTRDSDDGVQV